MMELTQEEKQRIAREYILELMKEQYPSEFKVGDRVRIVSTLGGEWFNGLLGTVKVTTSTDTMMVLPDNPHVYVTKAELL